MNGNLQGKEATLLTLRDLWEALAHGVHEIDTTAGPTRFGSEEYYDQLATALVAYAHADPRSGKAVENIRDAIKNMERTALVRAEAYLVLS